MVIVIALVTNRLYSLANAGDIHTKNTLDTPGALSLDSA